MLDFFLLFFGYAGCRASHSNVQFEFSVVIETLKHRTSALMLP